jgi:hypothetical protein
LWENAWEWVKKSLLSTYGEFKRGEAPLNKYLTLSLDGRGQGEGENILFSRYINISLFAKIVRLTPKTNKTQEHYYLC